MNLPTHNYILADGRWQGAHGIGRFATEVLSRLQNSDIFTAGPRPLSFTNLAWQSYLLTQKRNHKLFFTPGFNAPLFSSIPFVFTLHDLIHLHVPDRAAQIKKMFYACCIKPATKKAQKIITVSEFSKTEILNWTSITPTNIVVVGNGVSTHFTTAGPRYQPGFPYLLHVGNTKTHKNVVRLIAACAQASIDKSIKLICTGKLSNHVLATIKQYKMENRVISQENLSEQQLAEVYRGAVGITFPSLYEGFGLPVLEGMACGVPVLTSNTTSLPEVAGDAALLVDPNHVDSIAHGITQLVNDTTLRTQLISKGCARAQQFSWDKTAQRVQDVLTPA